ncbi:MAG: cyclase family protein [Acidobacteria bacterium]|nr:MAG: cyclase family protein [Acidobacteriota bacterium]REK03126.1 MAG: cyclase family protein [Acidobacteriota bacterium]REK15420.1 MAG: cyclase family protein [Acidobacteriota bacterium]REK42137.1 MAG: cyclase family protein [Acidobacteriota bacterium]
MIAVFFSACNSPETETGPDNGRPLETETQIVDLSYPFDEDTVYWVTAETFEHEEVFVGQNPNGFFYSAYNYAGAEHGGTHIDSPIHFAEGKLTVDEVPLEKLIGDGFKIDVSKKTPEDRDYLVSVADIEEWEKANGRIPDGAILLLETGFGQFYPDKAKYLGTAERGEEAIKKLSFPGLAPEAAKWLVDNRKINAIGIDTASIDRGRSETFDAHVTLMTNDIPAFENVANLDKLPAKGFRIIALPMKIKGGSGGPLRIIAEIPKQ